MVEEKADKAAGKKKVALSSSVKAFREIIITVALAALVFLLIHTTVQNFQVEGFSMEPTLDNGQFLLVNKVVYSRYKVAGWMQRLPFVDRDDDGIIEPFRNPRRGEVVVLHSPEESERNLIKRVIGVPGDIVQIQRGVVSVNGVTLEERKYIDKAGTSSLGPVRLGAEEYWVMGDNRTASSDSRAFGSVPRQNIIGKAWVSYWPLREFGLVHTFQTKIA